MSSITPFKLKDFAPLIQKLHEISPLVHCMTNDVVQNFTANVLLASGAIPAMITAKEEVEDFVAESNALLVNLGTLNHISSESIYLAAQTALKKNIPWVLDPVAIGSALKYRTDFARKLLEIKPTVIRGNPSEILRLANQKANSKGANGFDRSESAVSAACYLSKRYQSIVAVTGEIDYVVNEEQIYSINFGTEKLTKITGSGCSLSALVAAFIGSSNDYFKATSAACFMMAYAGKLASTEKGLGHFAVSLLDHLSLINIEMLETNDAKF